jgi:hypothetical protein
LKAGMDSSKSFVYERKHMLSPEQQVYEAEKGYKGAHFDHHYNFYNAIRNKGTVAENPLFGYRAAAPALLCNESYFNNKIIRWDPQNLKVVTA